MCEFFALKKREFFMNFCEFFMKLREFLYRLKIP